LNDAFVVDGPTRDALTADEKSSAAVLKRYVRGRDIAPWLVDPGNEWLIFTRGNFDIIKHSAIRKHLARFRPQLTPGVTGGRKPGSYEWFEIQDNIAYWKQFERPKIVSTKVSIRPTFALDRSGSYLANTAYFFPVETGALFLLSLLNSKVSFIYAKRVFVEKQGGWYEVQPLGLEAFPVPNATGKQQAIVEHLATYVQYLYKYLTTDKAARARDPQMRDYYEELLNAMVYELYLPDDLHDAGLRFFSLIEAAKVPNLDAMHHAKPDKVLGLLREKSEELSAPTHPLRAALQKLHTLEPIRIIEGKA
jgi:adenine-specific DNA-methyltransferase